MSDVTGAIMRMESLYEFGALENATDTTAFIDRVTDEVEHLRTGNKYLTERCEQLLNRAVTAEHDSLAIAAERASCAAIVQAALESLADDPDNPITDDMERGIRIYGRVSLRVLLRDIRARGES